MSTAWATGPSGSSVQGYPDLSINSVSAIEGSGGPRPFTFTVSLSAIAELPVAVDYRTLDGTATISNHDYVPASGTLVIPAGQGSGSITVTVIGDSIQEPTETFQLVLSNPSSATIASGIGIGTIQNDDPAPTIFVDDVRRAEGTLTPSTFSFRVWLSRGTTGVVRVDYTTIDGTATAADADYQPTFGTLVIGPKEREGTILVPVGPDYREEPDETFFVRLSHPQGGTIIDNTGQGTILNDDPPRPPLVTVLEPNGGEILYTGDPAWLRWTATSVDFPVTSVSLLISLDSGATFDSVIADGISNTGSFWWDPVTATTDTGASPVFSALLKVITYDVLGTVGEDVSDAPFAIHADPTRASTSTMLEVTPAKSYCAEKLTLRATVVPAGATGSVDFLEDRNLLGRVALNASGTAELSLTGVPVGSHSITAIYRGDAGYRSSRSPDVKSSVNLAPTHCALTFSPTEPTCNQKLTLSATVTPPGGSGSVRFYDGTVFLGDAPVDDRGMATLSLMNLAAGTHSLVADFTGDKCFAASGSEGLRAEVVRRPSGVVVSSDLNPAKSGDRVGLTALVSPGTATGAVEFFDGGASLGLATVVGGTAVLPVKLAEEGEHSIVAAYGGDSCLLGSYSTKLIQTVGAAPSLSIADASMDEGDCRSSDLSFAVTLSSPSSQEVSVDFSTRDGTATLADSDYSGASGTLGFAPGETSKSITVRVVGDTASEGDEVFEVVLSGPAIAVIADGIAEGTIRNDDSGNPSVAGFPWSASSLNRAPIETPHAAQAELTADARDGTWSRLPFPDVSMDAPWHFAAYDPVGRRFFLLLARDASCWELSLAGQPEWTMVSPIGPTPPPRERTAIAFDPLRGRLLLYGGWADYGFYDDLWELSLDPVPTWSRLSPAGDVPGPRAGHTITYDGAQNRLILFGGLDPGWHPLNDAYSLSLSDLNWTRVATSGPTPAGRQLHAAAFDHVEQRLFIFGGDALGNLYGPTGNANDLWALSFAGTPAWTPLSKPGGSPRKRYGHTLIHDPGGQRLVLFGGSENVYGDEMNDTWAFNLQGGGDWDSIEVAGPLPQPRNLHSAGYDPTTRSMLVLGGKKLYWPRLDTWRLSLSCEHWTAVSGPPPLLQRPSGVHDLLRRRMVVFGTDDRSGEQVVEALSLGANASWVPLVPTGPGPAPRRGHSAIYDSRRDRMVVFGGEWESASYNDIWALSLSGVPVWTQLFPTNVGPTARTDHAAVYDPVRDRMIILGGGYGAPSFCGTAQCWSPGFTQDAWVLSFGDLTWSRLPDDFNLLVGISSVYEPTNDRLLYYGGAVTNLRCIIGKEPVCSYVTQLSPSIRVLDLDEPHAWETVAADSSPPARAYHSAVLDQGGRRMLVFGGVALLPDGQGSASNEVWSLRLAEPPSWIRLSPKGPVPPAGGRQVVVFDPPGNAMWAYNVGGDGSVWRLQFDAPTPTLISRASVDVSYEHVWLTWQVSRDLPDSAVILRQEPRGQWVRAGLATMQEHERLVFVDTSVAPGLRYGYRLILWQPGTQLVADEVWVEVPAALRLALNAIHPNPSPRGLHVSFTLPTRAPARLDLVDVAGRRLVSREVGWLGAGPHEIDLSAGRQIASGLYFVRLTQGARTLIAKAAVIR